MIDKIDVLGRQFLDHLDVSNSNRMAQNILDLTALSFLLDHRLATLEGIAERIQQVRGVLPEDFRSPPVDARVAHLMSVLQDVYGSPPPRWKLKTIEGGRAGDESPNPPPRKPY